MSTYIWFYYIFTFDNYFILFHFNDEENIYTHLTIKLYRYYLYEYYMDGSEVSLNDLLSYFFFQFYFMCVDVVHIYFLNINDLNFGFLKSFKVRVVK